MEQEYKGYTIRIEQDMDPMDPRDWDNVGEMVCYHRSYTLGDHGRKREDRWTAESAHARIVELANESGAAFAADVYGAYDDEIVGKAIKYLQKKAAILPLYLLDHSGIWMRTGRFAEDSGGWDTSMVGYIIATPKKIKAEGVTRAKVLKMLENEVETYSKYISGDVVGYLVERDGEVVASCSGYYDVDDAMTDAKSEADADESTRKAKHIAKKKAEILNHVPLNKRQAYA